VKENFEFQHCFDPFSEKILLICFFTFYGNMPATQRNFYSWGIHGDGPHNIIEI
jgi:hypothetical protein